MVQSAANQSPVSNSLINRENTGKYLDFGLDLKVCDIRNRSRHRRFFLKFPKDPNRELILKSREVSGDIRELNEAIRVSAKRMSKILASKKVKLDAGRDHPKVRLDREQQRSLQSADQDHFGFAWPFAGESECVRQVQLCAESG